MILSRNLFSDSERRIIQALWKKSPQSKNDLGEACGISWATIVKMSNRLMDLGIIISSGMAVNETKPGKKELLYSLSKHFPLAIGIDVGYDRTHLLTMNLNGDVLYERDMDSPQNPTIQELLSFLTEIIDELLEKTKTKREQMVGIGIGVPAFIIPSWLKPDMHENRSDLQKHLSLHFSIPVFIEANARSSTYYLKWNNPFASNTDFVYISIRTGVGMSIVSNNTIFVGHQSLGSELGHFKVTSGNAPCRCGGNGCLESIINQNALFSSYRKEVLKDFSDERKTTSETILGIHDLFKRAHEGESPAKKIIENVTVQLARALSYSLLTIYIPNIIICANFGEFGDIILPIMAQELKKSLLPSMATNLIYLPMERVPFAQGDALMAFESYLGFK